MNISGFSSEHLNSLQSQLARNARLVARGKFLMQIISETGATGMSAKGLIRVANMFADNKVVTETWFMQAMNNRRMRPTQTHF